MKQSLLTSVLCLSVLTLFAQQKHSTADSMAFATYTAKIENEREAAERQKNYQRTDTLIRQWISKFDALPNKLKPGFKRMQASMYYNLACYNALSNRKEAALTAFEKAAENGWRKYPSTIYDSDLQSLHHEKRYIAALYMIWQHSDMAARLIKAGRYDHRPDKSIPQFTYQNAALPQLLNFKNKYHLDVVAGNGDELAKMKNLLLWVHNTVPHDGSAANPSTRNGQFLIELSKKEKQGYNCRMLATILKDVYQAEGFQARVVTCMPADTSDTDCHVINVVWSKTLHKWVWMDPTFNAYVTDNRGNLLGIEEVRDKLHHGQLSDLVLNSDANRNNSEPQNRDEYLGYYMSKNLFWLQCSASNEWDLETPKHGKSVVAYINLYPQNYNLVKTQQAIAINRNVKYVTNNAALFWQKPAMN